MPIVAGRSLGQEEIMRDTDTIVIGAGQAGLGMSYCLGGLSLTLLITIRGKGGYRVFNLSTLWMLGRDPTMTPVCELAVSIRS